MRQLNIAGRPINDDQPPYVIAELGSNHMGDFSVCMDMIEAAAQAGADAIKLQKRDNRLLFTPEAYDAPYNSEHAYAPTYGAHRDHLEFGIREFEKVKERCNELGIAFICTPFEENSVAFLAGLGLDAWKVASSHLKDLPLMKAMAKARPETPIIVSTGGSLPGDIRAAWDFLNDLKASFALLHCTSLYPTGDGDLNLDLIPALRNFFFDTIIGFSSHHPGIEPNIIAATLGAKIIEVHFTMNRGWPGTDHGFSFEPGGLKKLCDDLRRIHVMRGGDRKEQLLSREKKGFVRKQGRSIKAIRDIAAGETLSMESIGLRAPADGAAPCDLWRYLGKIAKHDIKAFTNMSQDMVIDIRPLGDR